MAVVPRLVVRVPGTFCAVLVGPDGQRIGLAKVRSRGATVELNACGGARSLPSFMLAIHFITSLPPLPRGPGPVRA